MGINKFYAYRNRKLLVHGVAITKKDALTAFAVLILLAFAFG